MHQPCFSFSVLKHCDKLLAVEFVWLIYNFITVNPNYGYRETPILCPIRFVVSVKMSQHLSIGLFLHIFLSRWAILLREIYFEYICNRCASMILEISSQAFKYNSLEKLKSSYVYPRYTKSDFVHRIQPN